MMVRHQSMERRFREKCVKNRFRAQRARNDRHIQRAVQKVLGQGWLQVCRSFNLELGELRQPNLKHQREQMGISVRRMPNEQEVFFPLVGYLATMNTKLDVLLSLAQLI